MTHCLDYWRKWKREGNFCGLRKQDAEDNDNYLTFVERISGNGTGLDADQVFENFSAGAARPLIRCKDEDVQVKALNYVVACLKRKETVTGGDLKQSINMWLGKPEKPAKVTQLREEEPAVPMEIAPETPILSLAQQQAVKESPFLTAAQLLEHDKDPLGVNKMFTKPEPATIQDSLTVPAKTEKELFLDACAAAYDHGKPDFKLAIDELMRYHPSWNTPGTVIYFCVTDPKEAARGRK